MRVAYFDCFNGAGGDMIAAAMIAAGLDADALVAELDKLGLDGVRVEAQRVRKQGLAATRFSVVADPGVAQPHRHLADIRRIIDHTELSSDVKARAMAIFGRLAEAEARVHGVSVEEVHFHEVGAADAIIDVVAAAAGAAMLGLQRVVVSPIPVGSGSVRCEHGVLPVPAPAVVELLAGVPLAATEETGELVTPTAAAVLTTLADEYGPIPAMAVSATGYGAGTREGQTRPNVLRLIVGEAEAGAELGVDRVETLQVNLDDLAPQVVGYLFERLLAAGALDVFVTPVVMKKNRPGFELTVLASPGRTAALEDILFAETTTLGIRRWTTRRETLERRIDRIKTPFGPVRMKVAERFGQVHGASPEYDDCQRAARRHDVPLRKVMDAALKTWRATRASRQPPPAGPRPGRAAD